MLDVRASTRGLMCLPAGEGISGAFPQEVVFPEKRQAASGRKKGQGGTRGNISRSVLCGAAHKWARHVTRLAPREATEFGFGSLNSREEADGERKEVGRAVACGDGALDHVEEPEGEEDDRDGKGKDEARTEGRHDRCDDAPEGPGNLEVEHVFSSGIEAWHVLFFEEPDDKRPEDVAEAHEKDACERAEVQDGDPLVRSGACGKRGWRLWLVHVGGSVDSSAEKCKASVHGGLPAVNVRVLR